MVLIIGLLTAFEVIVAVLMIGIILIQQSKAGGGLGAMGGGATESVFGAGAGNVLTKGTVVLAALFFGTTLLLAILTGHHNRAKSIADKLPDDARPAPVQVDQTTPPTEPAAPAESSTPGDEGAAVPAATPSVAPQAETAPPAAPAAPPPAAAPGGTEKPAAEAPPAAAPAPAAK